MGRALFPLTHNEQTDSVRALNCVVWFNLDYFASQADRRRGLNLKLNTSGLHCWLTWWRDNDLMPREISTTERGSD